MELAISIIGYLIGWFIGHNSYLAIHPKPAMDILESAAFIVGFIVCGLFGFLMMAKNDE